MLCQYIFYGYFIASSFSCQFLNIVFFNFRGGEHFFRMIASNFQRVLKIIKKLLIIAV